MNDMNAPIKNLVLLADLVMQSPVPLSRDTLQRWCRTGQLKCRKIGGRYFADAADFLRMVEGNHV